MLSNYLISTRLYVYNVTAGNYTLFAPTDQAFTKILQALPVVTADDQTFKSKFTLYLRNTIFLPVNKFHYVLIRSPQPNINYL